MNILFPKKSLVFVFSYMASVKHLPIFKMAAIVNLYRQMLTEAGYRRMLTRLSWPRQ